MIARLAIESRELARLVLDPAPTPPLPAPAPSTTPGGPQLWMKRDDLVPFGLGGDRVGGLEPIVADARAAGADAPVTGTGPLSDHVPATAAAAACAVLFLHGSGVPSLFVGGGDES